MWWRALGVAVVLLCAGVAGGYAVADRSESDPAGAARWSRCRPSRRRCPRLPSRPTCPIPGPSRSDLTCPLPSAGPAADRRGRGHRSTVPDGWRHYQAHRHELGTSPSRQSLQHLRACGSPWSGPERQAVSVAKAGPDRRAGKTLWLQPAEHARPPRHGAGYGRHLRGELHRRRRLPALRGALGGLRRRTPPTSSVAVDRPRPVTRRDCATWSVAPPRRCGRSRPALAAR